jgi:hypothetical protein
LRGYIGNSTAGLLSIFLYFSPSEKRSATQIGINRPVFLLFNRVIPNTMPVYQLSEKM